MKLGVSDRDLGPEVGLPAGVALAATPGARAGPTQSENREGCGHLVSKDDADLKRPVYFDVEYLVLFIDGHVRRVPPRSSGRLGVDARDLSAGNRHEPQQIGNLCGTHRGGSFNLLAERVNRHQE